MARSRNDLKIADFNGANLSGEIKPNGLDAALLEIKMEYA
jgi:hypothetical protein